jgi:hypothetical protein
MSDDPMGFPAMNIWLAIFKRRPFLQIYVVPTHMFTMSGLVYDPGPAFPENIHKRGNYNIWCPGFGEPTDYPLTQAIAGDFSEIIV